MALGDFLDEIHPHQVSAARAALLLHVAASPSGTKPRQCAVEGCGKWPCFEYRYQRLIWTLAPNSLKHPEPAGEETTDTSASVDGLRR